MTLNLADKNNYLIGMLVMIGKDRNIGNTNEKMIRLIADDMGLNHYFVDQSIEEIRGHKYIIEEPPEFSDREIAEAFIKDAIRFSFSDHAIHLYELHERIINKSSKIKNGTNFINESFLPDSINLAVFQLNNFYQVHTFL